jgi:hypothetical protein
LHFLSLTNSLSPSPYLSISLSVLLLAALCCCLGDSVLLLCSARIHTHAHKGGWD